MRVGVKHREELDTGGKPGEEAIETVEGRIGIGGAGERTEKRRHEARQQLTRPRGARRRESSRMPCADRFRHFRNAREAEPAQGLERFGIVVGPCEDEAATLLAEGRRRLEELGVMIAYAFETCGECPGEAFAIRKPHEAGDAVDILV